MNNQTHPCPECKRLINSELRYRRLFETAQDGVLLLNFDTGMILDVNPFLIKMLGFSKEEFLNKYLWEVGVFKDVAASKENFKTLQTKKFVRFEDLPLETKSGEKIDVEFVANAYQVDGTTIIQCNIRDITDRKKVEKALHTLSLRQEAVLKAIPDIIMEVNNDKVYMWANQPGLDFFGKDVIGKTADSFFEGKQDTYSIVQPIFEGSEDTQYIESWQRRIDGQKRLLAWWCRSLKDENGNVIGAISSARDITDHKNMETQIIEDKLQDEAVFDSIGDAVFACNKEGTILLFNKMAEELTGITITDAIDHHYNQIITFVRESDGKPVNDFITGAIKSKKITKMANHVMLLRKDGRKIPVADSAAPVINTTGEIIGCVVVFHDVTKEREVDKAKTELVSLASHQLRTPLTTLRWISEILASGDDGKLNEKQQQHAEEIHNASKRMIALVNALLNVSRLEMGTFTIEPQPINIKDAVKICMEELDLQISKKMLTFREKYDPSITSFSADPKLLNIILGNLLSDAIKYTPDSGQINLTVNKENDNILIAVTDTGIGIPQSQQNQIFNKLFRADNAQKADPEGTGLGLYMVKEIINHAGGKIWFISEEGKGTAFYISFPFSGMIKKEGEKQLT